MTSSSRLPLLAALTAALTVTAGAVGAARAGEQRPSPTPCGGVAVSDAAGDSHTAISPVAGVGPGQANLDIQRVFFRFAPGPDGTNVLSANIEVTNLDLTIPPGAQSIAWYIDFTLDGVTRYARATVGSNGQAVSEYGTWSGNTPTPDGETTGALYPGEKGIVEIVLPVDELGLTGKTLTDVYAIAGYVQGSGPSITMFQDRAPDPGSGYGKPFKATPCAEAGTATPVQPGIPQPSRPGQPQTQQPPTEAGTLALKVLAGKLSAKRVKKTRALSLQLQTGEPLRDLRARLVKSGKTIGTGTVASFGPGKATLKIKLTRKTAKKVRRGTYALSFSADEADGTRVSGSVQLALKG